MDTLYQEGKAAPALFKNQPPVAGSIFWERSLFLRMKNTIIKFLTMEDMMMTDRGKAVCTFICNGYGTMIDVDVYTSLPVYTSHCYFG